MRRAARRRSLALALLLAGCVAQGATRPPSASAVASDAIEIHWDRWQVPHVYASTRAGLGYGLGYAELRAYPDEILRMYAVARGEAAAIWGEGELGSDRMTRMLDLPRRAEQALAARTPEVRAYLEAFAQGMNDFAAAHPERLSAEAKQVLPVRPTDPIAHSLRGMLAFTLLTGQRPFIMTIDGQPRAELAGSNVWAIAPSRSASGNALLLANPHLPWRAPGSRFFEAHLVGPDAPLYGVATVGSTVLGIAFNDAIAWSHTVNILDTTDFFALVRDGDGYRFDGTKRAFEQHDERVRVKQRDGTMREENVRVRRSVHGPVLELKDGSLFAVKSGIDGANAGWIEAWLAMGRARDLATFEAALRTLQLPMFTVGYADRDGHILFLSTGRVPKRPQGAYDWFQPVRGDVSATLWDEILPYESLPRLVDPPGGFVQNSNSVPWFATMPPAFDRAEYGALGIPEGPLNLREIHGVKLLMGDDSVSFDELRTMQHSDRLELADHVLPDLLAATKGSKVAVVQRAAELLARWDRRARSPGAVLFEAWAQAIDWRTAYATQWTSAAPLATPSGLADPKAAVATLAEVAAALEAKHGALEVSWGEVHRLRADLPGVGASGQLGSFHVVDYEAREDGTLLPDSGDTYVALVELRKEGPRAEVLLTYGNASPSAPFAADQLELLAKGELRAPLLERSVIAAAAVESVRLVPQP